MLHDNKWSWSSLTENSTQKNTYAQAILEESIFDAETSFLMWAKRAGFEVSHFPDFASDAFVGALNLVLSGKGREEVVECTVLFSLFEAVFVSKIARSETPVAA